MPTFLLIPIVVMLVALVFMGVLAFLAKFRGGKYLQKIVLLLAKIPFMRRFFAWSQRKVTEKQNPELASVIRKLERLGPSPDPREVQRVTSRFTRAEKRAYDEYLALVRQQGALPEAPNRQTRRQQQRQATKPPAGSTSKKRRR